MWPGVSGPCGRSVLLTHIALLPSEFHYLRTNYKYLLWFSDTVKKIAMFPVVCSMYLATIDVFPVVVNGSEARSNTYVTRNYVFKQKKTMIVVCFTTLFI